MDANESDGIIRCAHALADAARPETLRLFRQAAALEAGAANKAAGGFDPVTEADRAAEKAMRDILARLRPQDAILGEEFGNTPGTSGLTWVLDPIDGTRGYIAGTPTWGVLIALSDETGPLYGIIDQPYTRERFEGGFGRAQLSGPLGETALRCRPPRPLSEALVMTTFPEVGIEAERRAFEAVSAQARLTRYGMDCYAYALVAAGQVDLVIEAGLQPYDVAAPIAVVQAAGGVVTDWQGGPAHGGGRILAAANPAIHAEALALLSGA
ncbi:inositol monophosphatase family protein [Pseudoroseicyclus aestuarii]|uniref:Histidinol phosphatase-like enzyme (Inositol monophosphatase family) n=1 Tax=Pseudoroseicyclus aestuarii TaxID=1795041 RepID=A0A318SQB8_9RHOB|nr:inositol monophosphatase family protein [Pseudoroseicyclus aestuarii]PYE82548.1 histidinol phosphatase-like enzyme (inositol monophosphatase family) [Pseudoroseicyclus aestuarii]